jgi:hypothetical protein
MKFQITLKHIVKTLLLIPILLIVYINGCLYYSPSKNVESVNLDVLSQLKYLKFQLHEKHAATEMQGLFPEGFVFTTALYGLAWADFAENLNKKSPLFQEAIDEIKWSIEQVQSEVGKANFDPNLPLKYGAYYTGWATYLMGKYLVLNPNDGIIAHIFNENCQYIKSAILDTKSPYLESYIGLAWPADNIMCLASLSLYEKFYPPQYKATISTWLSRIKQHLDGETGLIPHSFNPETNESAESARGSSQSLMNCFLMDIDSSFAKEQFALFKKHFIEKRLGLSAVLEYPIGVDKQGDVDSGPVIWGVGTAASIVAIRTMAVNDDSLYVPIRNSIEALGFANSFGKGKKYIFGALPVADAFLAWSNAAEKRVTPAPPFLWRCTFHLISLIIIVPFCWWVYRL